MIRISEVMTGKPETIPSSASLRDAAELMRSAGVGCIPVMDAGELVGFITDRDITVRATAKGLDPNVARVEDAMTSGVVTVPQDAPLAEAEALMASHAVHRLVVVNDYHQPVGIISIDDLVALPREVSRAAEVLRRLSVP